MMGAGATLIAFTILLPWAGALVVWGLRRAGAQHGLACAAATFTALVTLGLIPLTANGERLTLTLTLGGSWGDLTFAADGLSVLLSAIAAVIGALAVYFSVGYLHGTPPADLGRYYALVLIFIGAMSGLVLTEHLWLLFFFWELVALCSYALIAFYGDNPAAVRGGLKALILTQTGGLGLLVGCLVIGTALGDFRYGTFLAKAGDVPTGALALAAFGFLIAAAAKSAQVPFHSWLPDAMEAPTPVSALIHAATMVNAGVYLLARFYPAFVTVPGWADAVVIIGVVSALVGGLMSLATDDLKRVLACSTISQLGFMIYAVGVGAVFASQYHLLSHAIFKALLFLSAGAVIHSLGTRDMAHMGRVRADLPFISIMLLVGALALVGLPMLNGFWSKEAILDAGLSQGAGAAFLAMLVGVCLTALYAVRMLDRVVFRSPATDSPPAPPTPFVMRWVCGALCLGTLTSWLLAEPISRAFEATLPFHQTFAVSLPDMSAEIAESAALPLALAAMGLGAVIGGLRGWAMRRWSLPAGWQRFADEGFGVEPLNRLVIRITQGTADMARRTQTGHLNWNVAGIIGGWLVVMLLIVMGGAR